MNMVITYQWSQEIEKQRHCFQMSCRSRPEADPGISDKAQSTTRHMSHLRLLAWIRRNAFKVGVTMDIFNIFLALVVELSVDPDLMYRSISRENNEFELACNNDKLQSVKAIMFAVCSFPRLLATVVFLWKSRAVSDKIWLKGELTWGYFIVTVGMSVNQLVFGMLLKLDFVWIALGTYSMQVLNFVFVIVVPLWVQLKTMKRVSPQKTIRAFTSHVGEVPGSKRLTQFDHYLLQKHSRDLFANFLCK